MSSKIEKFIISNHLLIGHRFFEKSSRKTSSLPISNLGSTLESIFQRFFNFFQKTCKNQYYLVSRIFSTPPRKVSKIVSGSENESKPSLESFQVTKVDHISLFDHNFWMKTRWDRNRFWRPWKCWILCYFRPDGCLRQDCLPEIALRRKNA